MGPHGVYTYEADGTGHLAIYEEVLTRSKTGQSTGNENELAPGNS